MSNPKADRFVTLYRHQMGFEEAKKRRTYGRARVPKPNKSARTDFHPLGAFLQFLQSSSRESSALRSNFFCPEAHPLGRIKFSIFALFLVLDLVF